MPQMDMEEQFSLKWNDFQTNLTTGFQHLLEEEIMLDVTLSAGGQLIQAHKIILSICSTYFKNLFQTNPCKHPVIILKDVGPEELLDVLDFMYRGEVNVKKQNLGAFLRLAENLKVKGLVDNGTEEDDVDAECLESTRKTAVNKKSRLSESSNSEKTVQQISDEFSGPPKKRKKKLSQLTKLIESVIDEEKVIVPRNEFEDSEKIDDDGLESDKIDDLNTHNKNNYCSGFIDTNLENDNDDEEFGDDNMDDFSAGPSNSDDNADNLPSDYRRSAIWNYFIQDKWNETVMCKVCSRVFPNKKGWGTANMKRHLKVHTVENSYVQATLKQDGGVVTTYDLPTFF